MLSQIPIFIAARGNNDIKIKKNKCALKFSFVFIRRMGLLNQTYVISDNNDILDYAKRMGFRNTIYQECRTEKDVRYIEYNAIYNFYKTSGIKPDWFMILSNDELFTNSKLIIDCIRNIDMKYDVVTSFTEISNRSKYFLDDDEQISDVTIHRLTNEKDRRKMADASIYAISTDFAIKCMQSKDPAIAFWQGKFKFFKNQSIYTDINEYTDIQKFSYIGDTIDEVKKLNKLMKEDDL